MPYMECLGYDIFNIIADRQRKEHLRRISGILPPIQHVTSSRLVSIPSSSFLELRHGCQGTGVQQCGGDVRVGQLAEGHLLFLES